MNGTHKEEEDVGGGMPLFKINFVTDWNKRLASTT